MGWGGLTVTSRSVGNKQRTWGFFFGKQTLADRFSKYLRGGTPNRVTYWPKVEKLTIKANPTGHPQSGKFPPPLVVGVGLFWGGGWVGLFFCWVGCVWGGCVILCFFGGLLFWFFLVGGVGILYLGGGVWLCFVCFFIRVGVFLF